MGWRIDQKWLFFQSGIKSSAFSRNTVASRVESSVMDSSGSDEDYNIEDEDRSSSDSDLIDEDEIVNLQEDLNSPPIVHPKKKIRKSPGEYSNEEYNQLLQFKVDSSTLTVNKSEKEKIAKRAAKISLVDNGEGDWPKGKVLYKICSKKRGSIVGMIVI